MIINQILSQVLNIKVLSLELENLIHLITNQIRVG